jgi:hypothetical protein
LRIAIDAGVTHYRLQIAERVLLQETLVGCIKALVDILAITNPVAFGRSSNLAAAIGNKGFWELEAAAIGNTTLVESLEAMVGPAVGSEAVSEVSVGRVTPGMVFVDARLSKVPEDKWAEFADLRMATCVVFPSSRIN